MPQPLLVDKHILAQKYHYSFKQKQEAAAAQQGLNASHTATSKKGGMHICRCQMCACMRVDMRVRFRRAQGLEQETHAFS